MSILTESHLDDTPMRASRRRNAAKGGETAQFFMLCVMCFPFCLAQTIARRAIARVSGTRHTPRRSILKEASEAASICASSSFMGV